MTEPNWVKFGPPDNPPNEGPDTIWCRFCGKGADMFEDDEAWCYRCGEDGSGPEVDDDFDLDPRPADMSQYDARADEERGK